MDRLTDKPPLEKINKTLLNSVGVELKNDGSNLKFVYTDNKVIDELKQIGFVLDILKVQGGEIPLPILAEHLDEQASLEAYWSTKAENYRFLYNRAKEEFEFWYSVKYSECFNLLIEQGIPKPTQREVESKIIKKYKNSFRKKKERISKSEYKYRIVHNACLASIITKGKMLQSLRNVIQGNIYKVPSIEIEQDNIEDGVLRVRND